MQNFGFLMMRLIYLKPADQDAMCLDVLTLFKSIVHTVKLSDICVKTKISCRSKKTFLYIMYPFKLQLQ